MNEKRPSLSIIIPAYNEEEGIASLIERALTARDVIRQKADIDEVEIIVVNDGSRDRTPEIAARYTEIKLITYPKNKGYGAAIKQGFESATGDWLGFLDADGTCDPNFFVDLCRAMDREHADVVIGSRLGASSQMPAIRRLGNRIFAGLINLWSGVSITDSASGMRVIRRSSLPALYPLPDGLHFTPAMSCRAIFDPRLKITEIPMPYSERTGESKLRVIQDGFRFLRIIVDTALTYRPLRFFGALGGVFLLLGLAYSLYPVIHYLSHHRIEEWMIYRIVAVVVAFTVGFNLLAVGVLAQQSVSLIHEDFSPSQGPRAWLNRILLRPLLPWGAMLVLAGILLNGQSLWQYATTGHVTVHWIYVLTGGLLVTLGFEFISFGVLARVMNILMENKRFACESSRQAKR